MRKSGTRVYGPYQDKQRNSWTVVTIEEGARNARRFASQEDACKFISEVEEALQLEGPITIERALEEYERYLRAKGNKPVTVYTTMHRLRSLLGAQAGPLVRVSGTDGYARLAASKLAADTHRNTLSQARTFGRWCVKMGHLRRNPWEGIEPVGRRRKGKKQLRVDEARRFTAKCLEIGDDGAVAALCCLLLGLRASEVVQRVGRDVDDGGRLLWIDSSKTAAGKRCVDVPELLRAPLARLAVRRSPMDLVPPVVQPGPEERAGLIFPRSRFWLRDQVRRLCVLAGVEVVCPHGLRGTHASLAMAAGASSALVAASMGHASDAVTLAHYAQPGAVAAGAQERLLKVLAGGKR